MSLSTKIPDEALRELQGALGENNVSADQGILQVYSYQNSMGQPLFGLWQNNPIAVVLPASKEDVQAVERICTKYGFKLKPHSSGWIFTSFAVGRNVVVMDLRRMNKLVEINVDDGYAVIEPYCLAGEQQVEIMKHGLNTHVNGAGPNASNLASGTSLQGSGGTSQAMSNAERNTLGVEFCPFNGEETLYMGSPGTPNAGWFCGDGPGPSLRGMMRGAVGNVGGHGVYTRCGMKAYPWYVKPFDCHGSPPFFDVEPMDYYMVRTAFWPDWDSECDALYRISEAEIATYCARLGPGAYEEVLSCTNEEYLSMVDSGLYRNTFPKGSWTISIAACCQEELDSKLKTLLMIVDDTGGIVIDPLDMGSDANNVTIQTAIRGAYIFKAAFMPTGSWMCFPPMSYETIDNLWKVNQPINERIKQRLIDSEAIEDDYADNVYASLDEHGQFGHSESPYHTELWEPKEESISGVIEGSIASFKEFVPILYTPTPSNSKDMLNYVQFMAKVQRLLDPDHVGDSFFAMFYKMLRSVDDIDELEDKEVDAV